MIDLHTHSSASDGDLSPSLLMEKAVRIGLETIALTDHDTIAGLKEAEKAAKSLNLRFIPGIELEIQTEPVQNQGVEGETSGPRPDCLPISGEFHLLGLGIGGFSDEFTATLAWLGGIRERRNLKMIEKMRAAGIDVDYEEILKFAGGIAGDSTRIIGRPHFGAFLISRKLVKNPEQAFGRWLGKGRPFYVPREALEFGKAARLIHEAGGIAVLAHPKSLHVSWGRLPGLLAYLKEKGLDGVEAWHPAATVRSCKRLEDLARSLGLHITAGSDFHGVARPERKLGHTAGGRRIGEEFLEGVLP